MFGASDVNLTDSLKSTTSVSKTLKILNHLPSNSGPTAVRKETTKHFFFIIFGAFLFFWGKFPFLTPVKNKPLTPGAQ